MPAHPWMTGITQTVQWAAQLPAHPARPKGQDPVAMTPLSATVDEGPDDIVRLDLKEWCYITKQNDTPKGMRQFTTVKISDGAIHVGNGICFYSPQTRITLLTSNVLSIVSVDKGYEIRTVWDSKYLLLRNNVTAITRSQAIQEEQTPSSASLWEGFRRLLSRK